MIVFNLGCSSGHRFDGWFGSAEDYESQRRRSMLECPVCGDKKITKHLSAPRLNLGASGGAEPEPESQPQPAEKNLPVTAESAERARMLAAQTEFYKELKNMLATSDDVGERFAEEARRIHYNEAPARNIRGVATPEDARSLVEEGIDVLPVPGAWVPKETLQ